MNSWPQRFRRITSSGQFIPEIDGFRFLAITAVVWTHIVYIFTRHGARLQLDPVADHAKIVMERGAYGVEFFFVISGFILAFPFVRHFCHGGPPVTLGRYYLRRLTRLEPPYILTLIGFYAASLFLGESDLTRAQYLPTFLARAFYAHTLIYGDLPVLNGVTWTLEVEVQFYLLVPLFVGVFRLPAPVRRSLLLAIVVLWPWISWRTLTAQSSLPAFVHYFAAGFLLADLYLDVLAPRPRASLGNDFLALAIFSAIWAWPAAEFERPKILVLLILAFYFVVFRSVLFRRFFVNPWVTAIGGMCYSLYLLHFPLLVLVDRLLWKVAPALPFSKGVIALGALGIPAVLLVGGAFYLLVERPCMDSRWPAKLWHYIARKQRTVA